METGRRIFIIRSTLGMATLACANLARAADPANALQEADPLAKKHGYILDGSRVDKAKYPGFKSGQICGTCQIYEEKNKEWGGCLLFPDKLVHVNAWCDTWG